MKYLDEFRDPSLIEGLRKKILSSGTKLKVMEVCGTHTMVIGKTGLRSLLSPHVEMLSGPGCPVCVTDDRDIDRSIATAMISDVILATFGDMVAVPGSSFSLADAKARGGRVEVVYSPLDALRIAEENSGKRVVLLAVGFETTAPTVAATVIQAKKKRVQNFYILSLLKLIPPALKALASMETFSVDGLILPGHVSAIIGSKPYEFLASEFGIPCVIAGFEPSDIVHAIYRIFLMRQGEPAVEIGYSRAVKPDGNQRAIMTIEKVFKPVNARWRGISEIPLSGLALRDEYSDFDASTWEVEYPEAREKKGCRCGDVLCGLIVPTECPLFGASCTPETPVGPCMVSSEGTCASYYLYR